MSVSRAFTLRVRQPRSTISLRGRATFTGVTGALLEEGAAGATLGSPETSSSKEWTIIDAGSIGTTPVVFLRSTSGLNLEDWRGVVGLSSDTGDAQKWMLTDASLTSSAGAGKVLVQSLRGDHLEDRHGALGLAHEGGSYQMWTVMPRAVNVDTSSSSNLDTPPTRLAAAAADSSSALLSAMPATAESNRHRPRSVLSNPRRHHSRSLLFKPALSHQPTELLAPLEMATVGRAASLVGEETYQLGNIGILTCQPGYAPVDSSKPECERAALYLQKNFSRTVYWDWERARPAGCFYHDSDDYLGDTIYFNPYVGGDRFGDDMVVCRLSPPPPPPLPPSPPSPPLPPSAPPARGPQMCLSNIHADGVSMRADGSVIAGLSVWVWGSKTNPVPDGDLAGQTPATTTSPPSWGGSSICVYASPVMDQCFEIRDTADDTILNSVCTKLLPQELDRGALLFKRYKRLELDHGASLAFYFSPA